MADGANVQVSAGVDAAALAQISRELTAAVTAGFSAGFDVLKSELGKLTSGPIKEFSSQMEKAGKGANFSKTTVDVEALGKSFSATTQDSLRLVKAFQDIGAGLTATAAAIDRERSALNRSSIEQNTELSRASNERVATLRNEGKLAAIEAQSQGQLQLREAKTSGQQRVQITREVLDTIGRLEKGFGATIEGIAKTSVGAVGKVFDGLKSAFSRSDKEVFNNTVLKSQLTERESILRSSDKTFNNTTLQTSLNEREREVRSSFEKQTNTIRESVSRQETALAGLRESTQKGVLGQVSNATLLGGLGAGFAALGAIKSTFTIGADFARGLAVLQASLNLTGDDMKKVRQESIDLGNDVKLPGVSALDAAQAIQTLTKQFGALGTAALPAALAAAKATLELSRAARASGEDSAALIGSAVNVFKISANDAVFAADAITGALTRAAGVGFTDFKDSFIQGATVFEQFVGPAENAKNTLLDFNTSLAILAKNGITGANAGAGLKQFFLQASANTKKAIKENALLTKSAGETGTVFFDATGKARPFADSIEILRKGVSGLNDEARHNALAALFGSRSITIANALINSTGVSFGELRAQIAETGLAAKIAAAQNTGLAGAFDALKSVVETVQIILFEKVNKPLGAAVLAITNFANTILFSANPAMHELRIALEGVGIALGVLLGLKAAVEVLALIGKTVALVATPVGALVAVFAILGAGIALFADHTSNFGAQLSHIKDNIVGFGQGLIDKVQPVLTTISNFIQTTAIPAVVGWAKVLGGDLADAFHTVSDFITGTAVPTVVRWAGVVSRDLKGAFDVTVSFVKDTVIPGFQSFIGVLERDVFSKIAGVAQIVSNAVVTAGSAVAGFAQTIGSVVGPLIEPAVKGFQTLGTAIASFFSGGGLGKLGSGFAAAGVGIGSAFANIGSTLLTALKPVGATVLNFFKDAFSLAHLSSALNGVADFLNFLGEKIGQIATNPKVIAGIGIAVGTIALVAGKLGFALVTGLLQGIIDNVPQLLKDAGSLIVDNLITADIITKAILGAFVVGSILLPIVAFFRTVGQTASATFSESFTGGLKTTFSAGGGFLKALFGGSQSTDTSNLVKANKAFNAELQKTQNSLRILGSSTIVEPRTFDAAKKELEGLNGQFTSAQKAALGMRDNIRIALEGLGGLLSGGGQIVKGLAQIPIAFAKAGVSAVSAFLDKVSGSKLFGSVQVPASLGNIGTEAGQSIGSKLREGLVAAKGTVVGGFQEIEASLRQAATEGGTTVGKLVAGGIAKGVAGLTAGVFFGQQVGSSSGIDKLLGLGGLATTALAIGGPLGIATVGIGLLTAALTGGSDAAKVFNEHVDAIAKDLSPKLVDAVKAGKLSIDDLKKGLTFGGIDKTGVSDSVKSIIDTLSGTSKQTLQDFGKISFADAFSGIIDSGQPVKKVASDIRGDLFSLITASEEFKKTFGSNAAEAAKQLQLITAPGGISNVGQAQKLAGQGNKTFEGIDNLTGRQIDALSKLVGLFNDTTASVNANGKAVEAATSSAIAFGAGAAAQAAALARVGEAARTGAGQVADITQSFKNFAGEAARNGNAPVPSAVAVTTNLKKVNDLLGKININAQGGIIPASTPSNVQPAVDVNTALQNILTSKQDIDALFAQGILPPGVSGFQDALNTAILGVQGIGTNIQQAFADAANGPNGEAPKISVDVRAAIDSQQLKTAADNASKVIQAGIAEGVIITPADATKAIQPLVDEATRGVTSDVVKQQIIDAFANVVVTLTPGIDGSALLAQAQDAAANVQAAVNISIPSKLIPPVPGPTFGADVIAPFAASPIEIPTAVSKPTIPSDWTAAALIAATSGGTSIGAAIDTGVSTGIRGGFRAITDAAKAMADAAIKAAKVNFHIQSPSKVFQEIGGFVVAGLVNGLAAGNADVARAATNLSSSLVKPFVTNPVQDFINNIALDAGNLSGFASQVNLSVAQLGADAGSVFAKGMFGDNFAGLVKQDLLSGIDSGAIVDQASATKLLQPLLDAASKGATPAAKKLIEDAFNNTIVSLKPEIDQAAITRALVATTAAAKRAPALIIPAALHLSVADTTFATDVLNQAGRRVATSAASSLGKAITGGLAAGLGAGLKSVVSASKTVADAAITTTRLRFGIFSPSRVFQQIGQFVVAGLTKGLQDGQPDVISAVTDLISKAVDAATGVVNDASKALRSGSADLFSALFGSGSTAGKANFGSLQGDITQSFNSLAGALDDSFSKASDVLTQKAAGTLSRAQADLLGESGSSLNVNDVIGSSNRAALTSTIDSIVSLGKAMIDQGVSATQVTQTLQGYIDHTKALAVEYGLNGAQVNDLIDSLGLGTDALSTFVDTTARLATALGQTTTSAKALNDTVVATFKALTNGADAFKSIQGVGLSEDARAKVTSSLNAIASAADQNDQRAKSILDAINAGTALNLSDQLALNQGLNGRSINTTDQFGIANRTAFEQAIGSIRDLGEALLAGGSSAGYVTQQINDQIQALETYAASLGFNTQQIQDLVNEAGLGGASLAAFNQSVADATTIANQAAAAQQIANQAALNSLPAPGSLPANGGATATAPAVLNSLPGHAITINNYLPFGDPDAIALAQANSIATAVRLPV